MSADDKGGEGEVESLLTADPWRPMSAFFPWRVPTGERIEGLPLLSRRILQVGAAGQRVEGEAGLAGDAGFGTIDELHSQSTGTLGGCLILAHMRDPIIVFFWGQIY